MSELKTLKVFPRGEVTYALDWSSFDVTFYNGRVQKNRKKIHPSRTLSFTVSGSRKDWEYLRDFYNEHHGCLMPFLFNYDGNILQCRFAEKITLIQKRELKNIIGFEALVVLTVDNQKSPYNTLPKIKQFDIPIRGQIEDEIDWNTNILDMLVKGRGETWKIPVHRFTFSLSGTKKERDKLIQMYDMYGDFVPIEFPANDEIYKCFMPPTLEITDIREGQKIVGYRAEMTLTSVNELQDILSLQKEWAFLMGEEQLFQVYKPIAFLMGKFYGSLEFYNILPVVVGKDNQNKLDIENPTAVILGKEIEDVRTG